MCHRKLTVKLCRNVNFIHGQNGSGKSAILTAILTAKHGVRAPPAPSLCWCDIRCQLTLNAGAALLQLDRFAVASSSSQSSSSGDGSTV